MPDYNPETRSRPILLASSSPRRKDLMTTAGYVFTIASPDVDESLVRGEPSRKMVERLAREKARACVEKAGAHALVIACDTTVVIGKTRTILGKPVDAADARRMLKRISGKAHEVLSSYAVLEVNEGRVKKEIVKTVLTKVYIRKLSTNEIADYVATGEPLDKAGSYAAQGIGMSFIEKINGSYTNVVGLPMTELCDTLRKDFKEFPRWSQK